MSKEYIKIERTISKTSFGIETKDKLIEISGEEPGSDLSPEFKEQLWDDMSIDIDDLIEEFGKKKEDIRK